MSKPPGPKKSLSCMPPTTSSGRVPAAIVALASILAWASAVAGEWRKVPWTDDGDLPNPTQDSVTHAVALGTEDSSALPAPFQLSKNISGDAWSLSRLPANTGELDLGKRFTGSKEFANLQGGSLALVGGRVIPKGQSGGIELSLESLEPGRKYLLAVFGLGVIFTEKSPGKSGNRKFQIMVRTGDSPDQSEPLDVDPQGSFYIGCEYTAPSDGRFVVSFECAPEYADGAVVRLCSFLNYRIQ